MANRFTPDVRSIINDAWNRLMASVGVRATDFVLADTINEIDDRQDLAEERLASGEDRLDVVENITGTGTVPLETSAAMTLYVDAAGSDSNDGSIGSPFLTIQKAIDMVPKRIRHPVTINVGAGNFKGAYISGFCFEYAANPALGNWIEINGTLATASATGLMTGPVASSTAGSGATWGTVTVTGAGWTVNALSGKLFQVVSGTGSTAATPYTMIVSNTADTITVAGAWVTGTKPDATSTFAIKEWSTVINSGVIRPLLSSVSTPSTTEYGFFVSETGAGNATTGPVRLTKLKTTIRAAVTYSTEAIIQFDLCRFELSISNAYALTAAALNTYKYSYMVYRSSFSGSNSAGWLNGGGNLYYSVCQNNGTGNCVTVASQQATVLSSTYVLNCATGVNSSSGIVSLPFSKISNCTTGLYIAYATGLQCNLFSSDISNCTTAISALTSSPGLSIIAQATTGTGNTTAITVSAAVNCYLKSDCTITGATEISLDGVSHTLAEMRAGTPKYLTNATTGTRVWGD